MAAMFQAQTANWEETQEKMSQLVSRLSAFLVHSSRFILMNFALILRYVSFRWIFLITVLREFTQTLVVVLQGVEEAGHLPLIITNPSGSYPLVTSVTDVGRKVRIVSHTLAINFPLLSFKDIGFKIAQQIMIGNTTTGRELREQLVFPVVSSRPSITLLRAH